MQLSAHTTAPFPFSHLVPHATHTTFPISFPCYLPSVIYLRCICTFHWVKGFRTFSSAAAHSLPLPQLYCCTVCTHCLCTYRCLAWVCTGWFPHLPPHTSRTPAPYLARYRCLPFATTATTFHIPHPTTTCLATTLPSFLPILGVCTTCCSYCLGYSSLVPTIVPTLHLVVTIEAYKTCMLLEDSS